MLGLAQPPEDARTIAGHVRELVPDGATIQIGAGEPSMFLARAGAFEGKRDLGLHTEMAAPGIARLVECGVINGARKTLHPNLAIASAWSGSDIEDLKIVTNNPKFEVRDPECVLDVRTIAQNDNFYAMNLATALKHPFQVGSSLFIDQKLARIGPPLFDDCCRFSPD